MNISRVLTILIKDIKRAPRSGIVLLVFAYPILITVVIQLIFGSIFDPVPRVGIIDKGSSVVVADIVEGPTSVSRFEADAADKMWKEVELGNLDLGIVFPANFDAEIRAGRAPITEEKLSSRANAQALFKLEGIFAQSVSKITTKAAMTVVQVTLSDNVAKSWTDRLLPLVILLTFFIAGTFMTGFAIIDEKLRGTLRAILTGPTRVSEVIIAKSIFSFFMAMGASVLALWFNGALGVMSPVLALGFALAAIMTIEFGVMVGFAAKDVSSLYGIVKGVGPIMILAVMPFLWDGWPTWVSKMLPVWYVINPIVGIANEGHGFADVAFDLGIATVLCVVFLFLARLLANRKAASLDALG